MGWKDELAPEYKDLGVVKDLGDDAAGLNAFVKTAHHAQQKIRERVLTPPDPETATVADYDTFYASLGRPTEKRSYEPSDFPDVKFAEGVDRDEDFEKALLQEAYDTGNAPYQAERIFQGYARDLERRSKKAVTENDEVENRVDEDFAKAFGLAKEARLANAWDALVEMVGEEEAGKITATELKDGRKIGDVVPLIKALAEQGRAMKGHDGGNFPGGNKKGHGSFKQSPQEASEELSRLKATKEWSEAWTDKKNPGHKQAQAQFEALSRAASA